MAAKRSHIYGFRVGKMETEKALADPEARRRIRKRCLLVSCDEVNNDVAWPRVTGVPRTTMGGSIDSDADELPGTLFSPANEGGSDPALFDCFALRLLMKDAPPGKDRLCEHEHHNSRRPLQHGRVTLVEDEVIAANCATPPLATLRRWGVSHFQIRDRRKDPISRRAVVEFFSLRADHPARLAVIISSNYILDNRGLKKVVVVPLFPLSSGDRPSPGEDSITITLRGVASEFVVLSQMLAFVEQAKLRVVEYQEKIQTCPGPQMDIVFASVLKYLGIDSTRMPLPPRRRRVGPSP